MPRFRVMLRYGTSDEDGEEEDRSQVYEFNTEEERSSFIHGAEAVYALMSEWVEWVDVVPFKEEEDHDPTVRGSCLPK